MYKIIPFLKKSLPFLMTLFLWRMSVHFWNPAGILALIPIFYYTFVRHTKWFALFGFIFCFLIDYRCNLPLFWSCIYCLFYAADGFQNYIDIEHMDNNAQFGFMFFSGLGIILLIFSGLTWLNLVNNIWLFLWLNVLYIPITHLDNWAKQ